MKVKAPTEKNFRRAKVKPGKRKTARTWLSWRVLRIPLVILLVLYAAHRATSLVLNASALKVSRIVVEGNVRLSNGEVQQLAHGLYGSNILTADLAKHRQAILDSPWVSQAALRRVLPSTIEISVAERRPFGIGRIGNQLYLTDRDGTVIDEFGPQYAEFDLPIIDGLVRAPKNGKAAIDPARAELAARVIDAVASDPAVARRLSQIDVTDRYDAIVMLDDDPALLHVGTEKFLERLQSYLQVADRLRESVTEIDHVDLRFGERVFIRPRTGAGGSARPAAGGRSD